MAKAIKHNFEILSAFLLRLLAIPRPLWALTGIGTTLRIDFVEEGTYGSPEDECGLMVLVDDSTGRRYRIRGHELANLRICDSTLPDKIQTTNDFSELRGGKRFIDCGITDAYDLANIRLTLQRRIINYNRWAGSCTPLYINKAYKGYAEYLRKKMSGEVTLADHIALLQSGIEDGYSDYKHARYYPVFSLSRE